MNDIDGEKKLKDKNNLIYLKKLIKEGRNQKVYHKKIFKQNVNEFNNYYERKRFENDKRRKYIFLKRKKIFKLIK